MPPKRISCKKGYQLLLTEESNGKLVVLDVRSPCKFEHAHIKNAINIDVEEENYLSKFEQLDRDKSYLVYCNRGYDSDVAIRIMKRLGFNNIFHLYQGLNTWIEKDFPVFPS